MGPPRAMANSMNSLKGWMSASSKRGTTIIQGKGPSGHRGAPTQSGNNDAKIGSRLDAGEIIKKDGREYRRYNWQINSNAENASLRKGAQKDSHRKWSYADVEIKENPTKEEVTAGINQLFDDLFNNFDGDGK